MSEKTQATHEEEREDLLEQIITQGLEKISAQSKTATEAEALAEEAPAAPEPEGGGEDPPPADQKRRQSAVYLYLLVLFGAAFLMLLLAYFIQQRSNEDTISDLRDSMDLSREELLAEIRELEDRNAELEGKNDELHDELDRLSGELVQWQARYKEVDGKTVADLQNQIRDTRDELYSWESFWQLELAYQAENYLKCGHILLNQTQVFNNLTYSTPRVVQKRHDEIVRAVIDAGILDEDYEQHLDDYSELLELIY